MSKKTARLAGDGRKAAVAAVVAVLLGVLNLVPLHYSTRRDCPHGGAYVTSGITMGLPMAYFETANGDISECDGIVGAAGESSRRGFSAQAMLTDALVFGMVMLGLNLLLDRRTKA